MPGEEKPACIICSPAWFIRTCCRMGLVRFELTIDGSLRKRQVFWLSIPYLNTGFEHVQCSNGSSLLTASGSLGRPVALHHTPLYPESVPGSHRGLFRWSPSPCRTRPQPLIQILWIYRKVSLYSIRLILKLCYGYKKYTANMGTL